MKRSRSPDEAPPDSAALLTTHPNYGPESIPSSRAESEEAIEAPATKITELDLDDNNVTKIHMRCALPPHKEPQIFTTYDEYEAHYRNEHTNRCLECHKNFPSAHILILHIAEIHDSFVAVRRERGEKTYSCFVEGCEKVCSTPHKRQMHLIAKHAYPKNYFFCVTLHGIDGRCSLLLDSKKPRSKPYKPSKEKYQQQQQQQEKPLQEETITVPTAQTSTEPLQSPEEAGIPNQVNTKPEQKPDIEMEDLSTAMTSLRFAPRSIRFGHGKKSGFAKR
ncbi:hypothetical protein QBC35DRAFT_490218 [Podospora australis]|uniref:C2H2-type domain-containing protein n=1 Tax=Podospora australis TaxID=1536484 RepID=A0AAN7AKT7_9PEZI|nr:hypothetical protein QBC35DRAFT_490218 [Podospora australis]